MENIFQAFWKLVNPSLDQNSTYFDPLLLPSHMTPQSGAKHFHFFICGIGNTIQSGILFSSNEFLNLFAVWLDKDCWWSLQQRENSYSNPKMAPLWSWAKCNFNVICSFPKGRETTNGRVGWLLEFCIWFQHVDHRENRAIHKVSCESLFCNSSVGVTLDQRDCKTTAFLGIILTEILLSKWFKRKHSCFWN